MAGFSPVAAVSADQSQARVLRAPSKLKTHAAAVRSISGVSTSGISNAASARTTQRGLSMTADHATIGERRTAGFISPP